MPSSVMIVEDDSDCRESLAWVLEEHGHPTITAAHGEQALSTLATTAILPALLVVDLVMPVMGGARLLQALRASPWASIPVIILSAGADVAQVAPRLGAAGWLRKPVDIDDLLALVRQWAPTTPLP